VPFTNPLGFVAGIIVDFLILPFVNGLYKIIGYYGDVVYENNVKI